MAGVAQRQSVRSNDPEGCGFDPCRQRHDVDELRFSHYIVVRRDVPLGVALAQTAHAAGESFYLYSPERMAPAQAGAGERPAGGAIPRPYAIILGARDESRLLWLERRLLKAGVPHVAVREPDAPWNGALMAIGLVPGPKGELNPHVKEFNLLRELT